mmetsp:Transcript_21578/g.54960  ORF Transcript_21578/g.54960 Transcript_21578/m.54960 type:complete len:361 (+) Transcript_21578:582-1664(+)
MYSSNRVRATSGATSLNSRSFSWSPLNSSHVVSGPRPRAWRSSEPKRSAALRAARAASSSLARSLPTCSSHHARMWPASILATLSPAFSSSAALSSSKAVVEVSAMSASFTASFRVAFAFSYSASMSSSRSSNSSRGRLPPVLRSTARYASSPLTAAAYSFQRVLTLISPSWRCCASSSLNASRFLRSARRTSSLARSFSSFSCRSRSFWYSWYASSRSSLSSASYSGSPSSLVAALRHSLPILMPGVRSSSSRKAAMRRRRSARRSSFSLAAFSFCASWNSSSRSRSGTAFQRASSSSSSLAFLNPWLVLRSALSTIILWKSSRACLTRRRSSSFSSFLRACTYSLKHCFFSPRLLSAP